MLRETITLYHAGEKRSVELFQGDLTDLTAADAVDVLIVSAFPSDYTPVPGTLIGALFRKGIDVGALARDKDRDLRDHFSCWLSKEIVPPPGVDGIRFRRILCFEPHWRGLRGRLPSGDERPPAAAVEELYQGLAPFLGGPQGLYSVAMPPLATGNIGCAVEDMMVPLLRGALAWMRHSALRRVKIVCLRPDTFTAARKVFNRLRTEAVQHDVFVSYCHQDHVRVDDFCKRLRAEEHGLRLYRDGEALQGGDRWYETLLGAVRTSAQFVPFLSPGYLNSEMCLMEYYTALMCRERHGLPHFFPVLLQDAPLTRTMNDLHWEDGRCGDGVDHLDDALARLLRRLRG
jgi:hypothetical protein